MRSRFAGTLLTLDSSHAHCRSAGRRVWPAAARQADRRDRAILSLLALWWFGTPSAARLRTPRVLNRLLRSPDAESTGEWWRHPPNRTIGSCFATCQTAAPVRRLQSPGRQPVRRHLHGTASPAVRSLWHPLIVGRLCASSCGSASPQFGSPAGQWPRQYFTSSLPSVQSLQELAQNIEMPCRNCGFLGGSLVDTLVGENLGCACFLGIGLVARNEALVPDCCACASWWPKCCHCNDMHQCP